MKLYNTKTKMIEKFIPRDEIVTLYTCGPTVYHYAHVGNLRSYIMEDVLEKALIYNGYKVKRCMNITDVGHLASDADTGEDKMLKGAKRENKSVLEIAKIYTDAFFNDCEKLNIKKPEIVVPATSCIEEYIEIIEKLLKDGFAYESKGNIYFDTSRLEDYYSLTNHKIDELLIGARDDVTHDDSKKNPTDFVLWFTKSKFENQELKWESPFGLGYPGWHIECSSIAIKYLGEYLDIHCGGVDNIFPHHTNEIAQSESFLGHEWCNFWFHVEHLNDKSGKMSKSSGEFLTLSLLEKKGYNPLAYRLFCLQSHYRKQLVFSYEGLDGASNAYNKILSKTKELKPIGKKNETLINEYKEKFKNALNDDLNTSMAITILFDVLKLDTDEINKIELIESFDNVLGFDLLKKEKINSELEKYIQDKIQERNEAKQKKDYEKADLIRKELEGKNIFIKDTREGTIYELR